MENTQDKLLALKNEKKALRKSFAEQEKKIKLQEEKLRIEIEKVELEKIAKYGNLIAKILGRDLLPSDYEKFEKFLIENQANFKEKMQEKITETAVKKNIKSKNKITTDDVTEKDNSDR